MATVSRSHLAVDAGHLDLQRRVARLVRVRVRVRVRIRVRLDLQRRVARLLLRSQPLDDRHEGQAEEPGKG